MIEEIVKIVGRIAISYLIIVLLLLLLRSILLLREKKNTIYEDGYIVKGKLEQVCWVKALRRLDHLIADEEVTGARMLIGYKDGGAHAWIEYKKKGEVISYDPTTDETIHFKSPHSSTVSE